MASRKVAVYMTCGPGSAGAAEIAKRVRNATALNPPGGELVDDITYSSVDGASVFTHPLCFNPALTGGVRRRMQLRWRA